MTEQAFGSTNEQNVYSALAKLKLDFFYQYPLNGGTSVRGGQVIDFVIWQPPRPIALYVQGEYWHGRSTEMEDSMKQHDARRAGFEPMEIFERECETVEAAQNWLTRNIL
jgi:hypothetical protein